MMKEVKDSTPEKKMLERWKTINGGAGSQYRFEWLRGWQAVLIAILSAAGYGIAYVHELGVSEVFGIPQDLIVLNVTTILITIGEVLAVGFLTFSLMSLIYLLSIRYEIIRRTIRSVGLLIFIFLIVFALACLIRYRSLWPEASIIIFMGLFYFVLARIQRLPSQSDTGLTNQKSKAKLQPAEAYLKRVESFLFNRLGIMIFVAFVLVSLIFLGAYFSGKGDARSQNEFLVAPATSTTPELVVLREYGDNLVCAQFDRDKKLFARQLVVLRAGANPGLILRLERLGPLKMGEIVTYTGQPIP